MALCLKVGSFFNIQNIIFMFITTDTNTHYHYYTIRKKIYIIMLENV